MFRLYDETKAILLPPIHSTDHFLHLAAQPREAKGAAIRAIAVGAVAINDEESVRPEGREISIVDSSMREVYRAGQVAPGVRLRSSHVEDCELRIARFDRDVNVPAVRLERQQALEVGGCLGWFGGGCLGNPKV